MTRRLKVAVSNRHAHLTKETAAALEIAPKAEKWLGIGDNYASDTFVWAGGLKFRVLLPFRKYDQLEVLASDCSGLGITPTYRMSGQTDGAPRVQVGRGEPKVAVPAIVAVPHIHAPADVEAGEADVVLKGAKEIVLRGVRVWPTPECNEYVLHIDRDEALGYAVDDETVAEMEWL